MGNNVEDITDILNSLEGIEEVSLIPEGGQSYAFSAFDSILNRKVFLKLYWYSEEYKDSLLLEPRRLSSLYQSSDQIKNHIVNLYSAEKLRIDNEDFILLRMEFCDGESLSHIIDDYGLSLHKALDIIKKLCQGLHFLHSLKIAHRDIKPGNIMILANNCKLVDLGSAILLDQSNLSIRINSIKTLYYTPPEAFPPDKIYYISSDIYQIGTVLHEMVNGKFNLPLSFHKSVIKKYESLFKKKYEEFDDFEKTQLENENVKYFASRNLLIEKLKPFKEYIPTPLRRIIRKATTYNHKDRYESCLELRSELSKLTVPNWLQVDSNNWVVTNWNDKDFRIRINESKGREIFVFESSLTGKNRYRQNKRIKNFQQAITAING